MKIAIIGGAGFIGTHLTRAYLDAGHDVCIIDRLIKKNHPSIDPRARFYQVDLRDEKVCAILQAERPAIVSHHAVLPHRDLEEEQTLADADIHIRGLLNVLNGCVNAAVDRLIFASGGNNLYACRQTDTQPIKEEHALHPRTAQDISKVAGEWYIRFYTERYGLKHTIFRYADVYGEADSHQYHHPLSHCIRMLMEQRRPIIQGNGEETRDHIFIDDVVQANLQALKYGENRTLHISTGQGVTLNHMYDRAARILNSHVEPQYIVCRTGENSNVVILDNTQAQRTLNWRPAYSITEGIQQTIQRIKEQNRVNTAVNVEKEKGKEEEKVPVPAEATFTHA